MSEFPETAPQFAADDDSGYSITGLFSRFFRSKPEDGERPKSSGPTLLDNTTVVDKSDAVSTASSSYESREYWKDDEVHGEKEEESDLPINIKEGRSLPNVKRRISNLLALTSTGKSYNNTELKQYWMPDSVSKECYTCGERFTTFRRRHHCRVCGQIFCSRCCNQQIPGKIMNCTGDLRVCSYCGRVVLSYLKSSYPELSAEHLVLLNELENKFGETSEFESGEGVTPDREETRRKASVGYQEERFGAPRMDPSGRTILRFILDELESSGALTPSAHRYRLRTYSSCFPASQLVSALVSTNKAPDRAQATLLGGAFLKSGYIEPILQQDSSHTFSDSSTLYRIVPFEPLREEFLECGAETEPEFSDNRMRSSISSYTLDLNVEQETAHISKPPPEVQSMDVPTKHIDSAADSTIAVPLITDSDSLIDAVDWSEIDSKLLDPHKRQTLEQFRNIFSQHCGNFLRQVLDNEGVPQSWAEVVTPLACQVVKNIRPEKSKAWYAAMMDIRHYFQVKKVSGGERRECEIITGVVCSKNVCHRKMPLKMVEPRILLLSSSIMFQRDEGKYLSLEPVIMQEHDYIQRIVSKIVNLRPNIVIVGKSVARLAQDLLLDAGISLVLNVKPSVVDRLARVTGADILSSVDAHLGSPELGTCKLFQIRCYATDSGRQKTLMMFEGCKYSDLGCTVLLRGASTYELAKVKKATSMLIFAYFNARLEASYHMDANSLPPVAKEEFLDSLEDQPSNDDDLIKEGKSTKPTVKMQSTETVSDLSDPLRSTSVPDVSVEPSAHLAVEVPNEGNAFKKALHDNILSMSPFLKFSLPFLETEAGKNCALRSFFGRRLYWSGQFGDDGPQSKQRSSTVEEMPTIEKRLENVMIKDDHEFIRTKLTQPVDSVDVQTLLASYRASGCRLPILPLLSQPLPPMRRSSDSKPKDVLDPANHQRLAVLFCSYSPLSRNAPAFCVDPWIVDMEMYGRLDIPLGLFLERYCFRSEYTCGSNSCETPVIQHTRRFVHHGGVVHLQLRHLEIDYDCSNDIIMWSTCPECSLTTPVRYMSAGTKSLSFAKFLEMRFHGDMYRARGLNCPHSLFQNHVHYFALRHTFATFRYSKISAWEVLLPPQILHTEREAYNETAKMEELKTWIFMGNQVFNTVLNKVCSIALSESVSTSMRQQLQKDQAVFKMKTEEAQEKMSLSDDESSKNDVKHMWEVEDCLVMVKRYVSESIEEWNSRLNEAEITSKREEKRKSLDTKFQGLITDNFDGEKDSTDECPESTGEIVEEADEAKMDVSNHENESAVDTDDGETFQPPGPMDDGKKQPDKKSVKTILSQLLPNSSQNIHIQSTANHLEHYTMPLSAIPLVVYEREPSSIIAYALSCSEYRAGMEAIRNRQGDQRSPSTKRSGGEMKESQEPAAGDRRSGVLSYLRNSSTSAGSDKLDPRVSRGTTSSQDSLHQVANEPSTSAEDDNTGAPTSSGESSKTPHNNKSPKAATTSPNVDVQFSDSSASFKVRVYYAEEFAELRRAILPEGEEGFIRSLSRCVAWAASGGKSGSSFNKTKDDRFILKAMARIEIQQFIDFAPQYFNYINSRVNNSIPTLLGKILGVYRITCRSERSNTTVKLLVMEHLFHGRVIRHKFDLKGSMRNRLVETRNESEAETVLLDENLINMTCDSPLYILPHSKAVLMQAIHNDTLFLASLSVMDYSLLVGLDETNSYLVLGIIDYIRGYTWDKKIETMVKRIGQAKDPTIIPADEYRNRFIAAMHRYFLPVPDRWTGLSQGVDIYTKDIAG